MNFSFSDRLRYRFDNTMSKGTIALIGWLLITSIVLILIISLFVAVTQIAPDSAGFWDIVWMSLMRTLDAGTMGGDSGSWPFLFAMLAVTMGGVFIVSTLIGIMTSGIEGKIDELRKGRSKVVETGHTVILGWSPQVISIISELVTANENQIRTCIAILADRDKVEMEDEIRDKIGKTGRTRVVCRTGNPLDLSDLEIVNPQDSRSIIILAPDAEDPDTQVIKTILALSNSPNRRSSPYHIVAEIHNAKNLEVARMVGGDEVKLVQTGDLTSKITAQTCRQSGLSIIYTELLDFGGDEIYFNEEPNLQGKTFGEALLAYEKSAVMGLQYADGQVQLLPNMETIIQPGDKIVAVSEDDNTIKYIGQPEGAVDETAILEPQLRVQAPECTLVLGWNHRGASVLRELDSYVPSGSRVMVVADVSEIEAGLKNLSHALLNQSLEFLPGDITDRATLEALNISGFQHVIVLSYSDTLDPQVADARTLVTLLYLRSIAEKLGCSFSLVSEMLDLRNRKLAEVTKADDFIISDQLISLLLSQVSEDKDLAAIFEDLFDPEGAELYLKPAGDFVILGSPVNFYTVVEAARRQGAVAIGYRLQSEENDPNKSFGVYINPLKSTKVTFSSEDRIVVLAEN